MTDSISRAAEEYFGIKADPDDAQKFRAHLVKKHGILNQEIINKVFLSGEAAAFLTVSETYFFREPAHFSLLLELLPTLRSTLRSKGTLRICSAATSSGCEAYSIAMLIEAYNKTSNSPLSYHIDAFDINPRVIDIADKGLFGARAMREDGSCFHYLTHPFIKKVPASYQTAYQTDASLKKNIRFFVHNLMNELPSFYDIIFFRNSFIYFAPQKREKVLSNLCAALEEGGFLFLGVSETAGVQHPRLAGKNRNDVFYFQKIPELRTGAL